MNWNEIVNDVPKLSDGSHETFGPELCFMEMTAFLAGEPHSDHPRCASPVLTQYGIALNDRGQAFRDALEPIVVEMIGSANPALEQKRAEYLVFNVAKRILPIALTGVINKKLISAILAADDMSALTDAAYAAAYAAANAADAAYAANVAYATGAAADAADHINIPQIAAEILLEAIRLDPDKKPAEIDMSRVQVLREMSAT